LDLASASLRDRSEASHRDAASKDLALEAAEAKKAAADVVEARARVAAQAQREKLCEASERVKDAERELRSVQASQKECARQRAVHMKVKDKLKALEEEGLMPLVDNNFSLEKDAKKALAKLLRDADKMGLAESCPPSLSTVLLQKKEERKEFDEVVIDHVRGAMSQKAASVDAALEANQAQALALVADFEAKEQPLQVLKAEAAEEAAAFQREQSALDEAMKTGRQEAKTVESARSQCRDLQAAVIALEAETSKVQAVWKSFEAIVCRSEEKPLNTEEKPEITQTL